MKIVIKAHMQLYYMNKSIKQKNNKFCTELTEQGNCGKPAIGMYKFINNESFDISIPLCEEHAPDETNNYVEVVEKY